jgi:DNA-binding NtrC family response regulator
MPSSSCAPAAVPRTALVIEPLLADQVLTVATLSSAGFQVTVADNFHVARALLEECPPTVLLTELRLNEYNGLHLVLRGKASYSSMAAVVTSAWIDLALQAEAESMGATFINKPLGRQELLAAVLRTLHRTGNDPVTPIRPPFERRSLERRTIDLPFTPDRRMSFGRRREDLIDTAAIAPAAG